MNSEPRGSTVGQVGNGQDARSDITHSIDVIRSALEAMKFGAITLTVHNARVVQLDITEKRRLDP